MLSEHINFSKQRLGVLSQELAKIDLLSSEFASLAVFVCGSYGRLEAHSKSDLDVFFVNTYSPVLGKGESFKSNLSRLKQFELWAKFVEATSQIGFPLPTDDGVYLVVHELHDIQRNLGGPHDDALNEFTTRMLLLLESRPVCNQVSYEYLVDKVISIYFKDYDDHDSDFKPLFLLNDIIRYWKTMCLNYEHRRKIKEIDVAVDDPTLKETKKAQVRLKNLKLKYSRLMICYSMVIAIAGLRDCTADKIKTLVAMTPIERIQTLHIQSPAIVEKILTSYEGFLNEVASEDILSRLQSPTERSTFYSAADEFSSNIYDLLAGTSTPKFLRYVTI